MKKNAMLTLFLALMVVASGTAAAVVIMNSNNGNDAPAIGDKELMDQFLEICEVPRCSNHNENMGEYLMDFAKKNSLEAKMDSAGNVMIDHPGSRDSGIVLQAHQDMVPVVDPGLTHNFVTDPIKTTIENGYVHAQGTTLGADDGSGIAICLCALKEPNLKDVHFKCIFTVNEETDFYGVMNLSADWLKDSKYYINVDSEDKNTICIGSAGFASLSVEYQYEVAAEKKECYGLEIGGLLGGHSGIMIDKDHANGILLAAGFLDRLEGVAIASIEGGQAGNAIPNDCMVIFSCNNTKDDVAGKLNGYLNETKEKYPVETGVSMNLEEYGPYDVWTQDSSSKLIKALLSADNGVIKKTDQGVITSSNIGTVLKMGGKISMNITIRSALDADLADCKTKISNTFTSVGASVKVSSEGSGWLENNDTALIYKVTGLMKDVFKETPKVEVIHAGLECGEIKKLNTGLEIISIGPQIYDAHKTTERMEIQSFYDTWHVVYKVLRQGI